MSDVPKHVGQAIEALFSPPEDIFYCHRCDGLRQKVHECRCWLCWSRGLPDGTCDVCLKEKANGQSELPLPNV